MRNGKWKRFSLLFLVFFAVVIFCSCSCSCSEDAGNDIAVKSLVLSTDSLNELNVKKGQKFTISYTLTPTNATTMGVYISSDNSNVISVNESDRNLDESKGTVTFWAYREGSANITFVSKDGGFQKSCKVNVYEPKKLEAPKNIKFDGTKLVWDKVEKDVNGTPRKCDESYMVSISTDNSGEVISLTTSSNSLYASTAFSYMEDVRYTVSVQAYGDDIRNSNSEYSASYSFYILSAPIYEVKNGNVNWYDRISNASRQPNYYIVTYSDNGDYEILDKQQLKLTDYIDIQDFLISIQPVRIDKNINADQAKQTIKEVYESGELIHFVDGGVDFISKTKTQEFKIHKAIKPTNVKLVNTNTGVRNIYGIPIDGAILNSKLVWTGESIDYAGKIKYKVKISNIISNKEMEIELGAGINELEFTEDFVKEMVNTLKESESKLTTYLVSILPVLVNSSDSDKIITTSSISTIYRFNYFNIQASALDMNMDLETGELNFTRPTSGSAEYFNKFQFVFINLESKDYRIAMPEGNVVDIKSALVGTQGNYSIFVNCIGLDGGYNLGCLNILSLRYVNTSGEAEVVKTISAPKGLKITNTGEIQWQYVQDVKEYRVELKLNDSTTLTTIVPNGETGNESDIYSCNLFTLLSTGGLAYEDLNAGVDYEIRVVSVSGEVGVVDAPSNPVIFRKLNQVQNIKYSKGVVSWDKLDGVQKYQVRLNNGNVLELNKDTTKVCLYDYTNLNSKIIDGVNVFSIIGIGAEGEGNLNAIEASININRTSQPTIARLEQNILYWNEDDVEGNIYDLTIYRYNKEQSKNEELFKITGIYKNFYDMSQIENFALLSVNVVGYSNSTIKSRPSNNFYFQRLALNDFTVVKNGVNFFIQWDKVEGAMKYVISGLNEEITISESENYIADTNQYRYMLSNLDENKKYDISIVALNDKSFLSQNVSASVPAYVKSDIKTLSIVKLPKVAFDYDSQSVSWNLDSWDLYEEFASRVRNYILNIEDGDGNKIVNNETKLYNENTYNFSKLDAKTYIITVKLNGLLTLDNNNVYVLDGDESTYEVTKLATVNISVSNGKLVFDRTIEGVPTGSSAQCDNYQLYANGKLMTDGYSIEEDRANKKIIVTISNMIGNETSYSVIVSRPKSLSGVRKHFLDSNMSLGLKATNINVTSFEKVGNNFVFKPTILVGGEDVANSYLIEGLHYVNGKKDAGYSYRKEIVANDPSLFSNGKYTLACDAITAGAGEYVFKITVSGKEYEKDGVVTAYLGDIVGLETSVVVLNNPSISNALIENGGVYIYEYEKASANDLDIPIYVYITFKCFNEQTSDYEVYGNPISVRYSTLEFTNKKCELSLAENFLGAGQYKIYMQFIGDENALVSSEEILVNNEKTVTKVQTTNAFVLNGNLSWNEIEGASYILYFDDKEITVSPNDENVKIENGIVTYNTNTFEAGRKTLRIQVQKDGCLLSNKGDEFILIKINTMELKLDDNNGTKVLTWLNVKEGTERQAIFIDGEYLTDVELTKTSYRFDSNQEVGSHAYSYVSIGSLDTRLGSSNIGYLTSNASNSITINYLSPYQELKVSKGIVSWNEIEGVLTYKVSVYKLSGFPDTKELAGSNSYIFTNNTEYDINSFNLEAGDYAVVVEIFNIDKLSPILVSTNSKVELKYARILKIDKLAERSIYSNLRVENGNFAFDITLDYLNALVNKLKAIDEGNADIYNGITLENLSKILAGDEEVQNLKSIVYPLINFKAEINGVEIDDEVPSGFNLKENALTLYYEIKGEANEYVVRFKGVGNKADAKSITYLNCEYTDFIEATKPNKPNCPIINDTSIVKGILTWTAPAGYDGSYILELKSNKSTIIKEILVSAEDSDNVWVAKLQDMKIMLDLNKLVEANELTESEEYSITIYTSGTKDSSEFGFSGVKYLTGVKNELDKTFMSLSTPEVFRADNGDVYWSAVNGALNYELTFFLYNEEANNYDNLITSEPLVITPDQTRFSVFENENFVSGRYKVGIKSKGDGNYKIDSKIRYGYFYKAGEVQTLIEDGLFAFDAINYLVLDSNGDISASNRTIDNYLIRVVERNSGEGNEEHDWVRSSALKKVGSRYYYELPDSYNKEMSDYKLEVRALGNNVQCLNGEVYASGYYSRSKTPTNFNLLKNGNITWNEIEDTYIVYVKSTGSEIRVSFDGNNATSENIFDINAYATSLNSFGAYQICLQSLHINPTEEQTGENTYLRSPRSIKFTINTLKTLAVTLSEGKINWQTGSFGTLQDEITNSYLTIKGLFRINGATDVESKLIVRCLSTMPLFENQEYYVNFIQESNNEYYYIDLCDYSEKENTIMLIGGENYEVSVRYEGYEGSIEANGSYLASCKDSNKANINALNAPSNILQATRLELENKGFNYNNYIKFDKVSGAFGYNVRVSRNDENGVTILNIYNNETDSDVFEEETNIIYFAIDDIIKMFNKAEFEDKTIYIEIMSIGSSGNADGGYISSLYSNRIEIEYPKTPLNFRYNGKGLITWENASTGNVEIEIKYKQLLSYGSNYKDLNNYPDELIRVSTSGIGSNITVVDRTKGLLGEKDKSGSYQLKYLTERILYIKIRVLSGELISEEAILMEGADDGLSTGDNGTNKFMLFNAGDGSLNNPYKIVNEKQFNNISHYLSSNFSITTNIAFTEDIYPIGSASATVGSINNGVAKEFTGTIEGNNKILSNVSFKGDGASDNQVYYAGLFYGLGADASIKNLSIQLKGTSTSLQQKTSYVGVLVAGKSYGTIENVSVSGMMSVVAGSSTTYVGGLVNQNYGTINGGDNGSIINISIVVNSTRSSSLGGVAYQNYGTISKMKVSANGTSQKLQAMNVGGLVVYNYGELKEDVVRANIVADGASLNSSEVKAGGLVAYASSSADSSFTKSSIYGCLVEVKITVQNVASNSKANVGGLIGESVSTSITQTYVALTGLTKTNVSGTINAGKVYGNYTNAEVSIVYYNSTAVSSVYGTYGTVAPKNEISTTAPQTIVNNLNGSSSPAIFKYDSGLKLSYEE